MITSTAFCAKRYAVLGLARSGLATAEALVASGAEVIAWDQGEEARARLPAGASLADPLEMDLTGFAGVVVSPGVPINTHPIADHALRFGVPLIGDIELFAQARADLPAHRVAAITGTNGKSTTTALLHHILVNAGIPAQMGGNIGLPILDQEPLVPNDNGSGVYVLELSSYQIDLTHSLACDVAALLNITPDHLDRYDSFDHYASSKGRLFAMQRADQMAVFGASDAPTRAVMQAQQARRPQGRAIAIDCAAIGSWQADWPCLQGPHNLENAAAAAAMAEELGVTQAQWRAALASFTGLPHRMERIGEYDAIMFINDSKATNPASSAPALAAFPPVQRPRIHWIVGGLAKEDGLGECEPYLGNVAAAYTIGDAGPRFAALLGGTVPVQQCGLLSDAVQRAIAAARPGDVVLLSPACASFDQFADFEKRGDCFRDLVAELAETKAGAKDAANVHGIGNSAA